MGPVSTKTPTLGTELQDAGWVRGRAIEGCPGKLQKAVLSPHQEGILTSHPNPSQGADRPLVIFSPTVESLPSLIGLSL